MNPPPSASVTGVESETDSHRACFNNAQLATLEDAVFIAEELVSNYYKMSSAQWLKSRYDIKTLKDLDENEIVEGPFAQVLGYQTNIGSKTLGVKRGDYYKVCIQDHAILNHPNIQLSIQEKENSGKGGKGRLSLFPFLIYITVHELVHIVRFATFQQIYAVASEADCAREEERKVHGVCREILNGVSIKGMGNVLLFYEKWRKDTSEKVNEKK